MNDIIHIARHVLQHSLEDTLYLIPFLFVTYMFMEWVEHYAQDKTEVAVRKAGAAGPVVGAVLGVVPQCGFSAAAATLYAGRVVTLGTLFAVLLSTSDEMLPIFIASQVPLSTIASVLGIKILVGIVVGFCVDTLMHLTKHNQHNLVIHELCKRERCSCHNTSSELSDDSSSTHYHEADAKHQHSHSHSTLLKSALVHTLQATVFVFVITIMVNAAFELVGEEVLSDFLSANASLSVFACALVGLVPNCAASIAIAQLYADGVLGVGSMLSGLLVSAGVGLLILCRANRRPVENAAIIVSLYVIGVACGLAANAWDIVL